MDGGSCANQVRMRVAVEPGDDAGYITDALGTCTVVSPCVR
jgi:hypothetical protein